MTDRRHPGPRVEDMAHAVLSQHREVHGSEKFIVADLDGILPLPRQRRQELIQPVGKPLGADAAGLGDGLELEDEGAGVRAEVALVRLENLLYEQIRVKKIRVDLAGPVRI